MLVPGDVLIRDTEGEIVSVVGVSGENANNDGAAAIASIEATGPAAAGGE